MAQYNDDLTTLMSCLATTFGDEVGLAVKEKFDQLLALEGADITALSQQIQTLNAVISGNGTADATVAQNLLAQLAALDARLDVLEASTAISSLQESYATLTSAITTESTIRIEADAALQQAIDGVADTVSSLQNQLTALQNQTPATGTDCDCAALTAAIAAQATAIANLQAGDAAQATQITALQAAVEALEVQAAGIASAQAAAAAAQATAQTALAAAAAAQAAADAAAQAAATARTEVENEHAYNVGEHAKHVSKAEVQAIDCAALGLAFRTAMRARMF